MVQKEKNKIEGKLKKNQNLKNSKRNHISCTCRNYHCFNNISNNKCEYDIWRGWNSKKG